VNPGTPVVVATGVGDWVAAGDGSVYWATPTLTTPVTVSRWVAATGTTTPLGTLAGYETGMRADASGVVWADSLPVQYLSNTVALNAWAPGSAAPQQLYAATGAPDWLFLFALGPSDVFFKIYDGGATGESTDGTVTHVPRAGGSPQTFLTDVGQTTYNTGAVVGSTVYIVGTTAGFGSTGTPAAFTVPLSGGTAQLWNEYPLGLTTDGTSFFAMGAGGGGSEIFQIPEVPNPTASPVAFLSQSTWQSPAWAVDPSNVYIFDPAAQAIRRVAR
jgi:hypothetical protein